MVKTGNECQLTDYMSSRGENCCDSLFRGSVVPAKFLHVLLDTLPAGSASGMDNLAFHVQGVCVCDARKNDTCSS